MIKEIEFRACIAPIMSGIRTGGDGLRLTLDIPESDVKDAVALIALRNVPLMVSIKVDTSPVATRIQRPDDEKPEKKKREKKPKAEKLRGPYGRYWQAMYKHGALNSPDLPAALNTSETGEKAIKQAIKDWFDVSSLTFLSPATFEDFCEHGQLHSLITISRQAEAEAQA